MAITMCVWIIKIMIYLTKRKLSAFVCNIIQMRALTTTGNNERGTFFE